MKIELEKKDVDNLILEHLSKMGFDKNSISSDDITFTTKGVNKQNLIFQINNLQPISSFNQKKEESINIINTNSGVSQQKFNNIYVEHTGKEEDSRQVS